MKNLIKYILNQLDLDIHRKSLYENADDPIYALEVLFENIVLKSIVDGGASTGTLAGRFSNSFPDARVYAFEPYQPHFHALQKVANNNNRIIPVKKGLGNRNGNRSFFSESGKWHQFLSSSN